MKTHTLLSTAAVALLISSGALAQSQRSEQRDPPGSKAERLQDTNTNAGQAQSQPGSNRELNGRNVRSVYPNNQNAQSPAAQNAPGQQQSGSPAQNQRGPQPSQSTQTQGNTQQPVQQSAQPSTTQQNAQPSNAQRSGQPSNNTQQSAQPSNAQTPATAQQPSSQPSGTAQSPQQSNTSQQAQPAPSANTQQPNQQARQPAASRQQSGQENNTRQSTSGVVSLSTQQQTRIGQTIARHNVRPVTNVNFSISVGTQVPRSVQLRALPSDLVTFLPQYRGYSYFVVEEQIVIVEPSSHEIMAVVPYAGSTRTAAPSRGGAMTSRSVKLDSGQRDVIRNHVTRERKPVESSATVTTRKRYSVGERVPRSVTIESFPETVYTEVPTVRRYRYFRNDDDVMLIDPDEDRIVEIIR